MKILFEPMLAEPATLVLSALFLLMLFGTVIICAVIAVIYLLAKKRETKNPVPPAKPTPAASPTTIINSNCPRCGTPFSSDALAGLCPACLLKMGAATDTVTDAKQPPFIPPVLAELAAKFPQLEILELIGKGGMGAVYKARQKQLDRIVALKILPPDIGSDPAFAERFTREAKALAKLNHPNIVTLYEFGEASGQFYFLMEFVDGVNLRQLLQNRPVSAREALAIVPQICDALQFAHDQGIVHRDIKPENILLDRRGRVKVADFGLAKIIGGKNETDGGEKISVSANLTDAGKIMGTPNYMSPEQKENPGDVDHRADIYALGVVFYQMLTGELPDKKIEPPSKKVSIDVRLDEIVLRALEKKPELRYQQASVLKTQIETLATSAEDSQSQNLQPKGRKINFARAFYVGLTIFLSVFTLATFITLLTPKMYRSTARVMFHNDKLDAARSAEEFSWILHDVKFFPASSTVLDEAAKQLDLKHKWAAQFGETELSDPEVRQILNKLLTVELVPNTSLVSITAYNQKSTAAAEIANAIAEATQKAITTTKFSTGEYQFEVEIVDSAQPSRHPIRPNIPLNLFIGIVVGIFLGLAGGIISLLFGSLQKFDALSPDGIKIVQAVKAWLQTVDEKNYAQSWEDASRIFQRAISKDEWISKLQKIRQPLGQIGRRELVSAKFRAAGKLFVAKFDSAFDGLLSARETVTFVAQADGGWKVVSYFIVPAKNEARGWKIAFSCMLATSLLITAIFIGMSVLNSIVGHSVSASGEFSDSRFASTNNFFIGQTYFPKGDSIEITSVERTENRMTVKGHYNLVSADEASLWLNITATNNDEVPNQTETPQNLHISKGAGDFELSRSQIAPGLPHVSMYDNHHAFASIYFGTKDEALAESKLNLSETNQTVSPLSYQWYFNPSNKNSFEATNVISPEN
jgi:serine/threonine protein kinase